jgi:hypothetical protein
VKVGEPGHDATPNDTPRSAAHKIAEPGLAAPAGEIAVNLGNQPNKRDDTALGGRLAVVAIRTHERSTIHDPTTLTAAS